MPLPPGTHQLGPDVVFGDVAVVVLPGAIRTHAGIVYLTSVEGHRLLHLAFHHQLERTAPPDSGVFANVDLPARLTPYFLMLLDKLEPANRRSINYALGYDGTVRFDVGDGHIVLGPSCIGLTCSTFILAVFDSVGFPLVEIETWVRRPDDAAVRTALLALLQRREDAGRIERGYTAKVRAESERCTRVRPEDVLAAVIAPNPPHPLSVIADHSDAIGAYVIELT